MSSSWRHSCCCWNSRRADDVWHKCLARREFFHTSIFLMIEIPPSYSVLCQTKVELNKERSKRRQTFFVLGSWISISLRCFPFLLRFHTTTTKSGDEEVEWKFFEEISSSSASDSQLEPSKNAEITWIFFITSSIFLLHFFVFSSLCFLVLWKFQISFSPIFFPHIGSDDTRTAHIKLLMLVLLDNHLLNFQQTKRSQCLWVLVC